MLVLLIITLLISVTLNLLQLVLSLNKPTKVEKHLVKLFSKKAEIINPNNILDEIEI